MENIRFVKWIMSLSERDRALALVVSACLAMWMQGLYDRKQYNNLQERYRIEIIKRTDANDERLNEMLLQRNEDLGITRRKLDSLMIVNNQIIINNNQKLKNKSSR